MAATVRALLCAVWRVKRCVRSETGKAATSNVRFMFTVTGLLVIGSVR